MKPAIQIENCSKYYRLGEYSTKTFAEELKGWFKKRKVSAIAENDRSSAQSSETHIWALKDIDFSLKKGEVVGIIGKNGAGKSTLLKLLSRITSPSSGSITINGRIGALLEVGTGFQPDLTGLENIYLNGAILGMTKLEIDDKIDDIIAFSGCAKYINTPVKRYSSGMNVRLGFSIAAHLEPEILVIDEVLAVGDQDFQNQCVKKMKDFASKGKTVLFVSHNMASVKSICSRGIVLEKGSIAFDGNIDDAIQHYLEGQEKADENGEVSPDVGEINTGEARFSKIICSGTKSNAKNSMLYGENMKMLIEVDAQKRAEMNIEFLINTSDNMVLGGANNVFDQQKIVLDKGINTFEIEIETPLIPNNYNITATIAQKNGTTVHYLPNYIDITVESIPIDKDKPYPFIWKNGSVRFKSVWENPNKKNQ